MRSSMSCHSRPGHRALHVSTTSSVFTCTLIEATVTPASCQHRKVTFWIEQSLPLPLSDVYAPTGFNEVFPALPRPATRHKIFLLLNHQKTSGTLWPSLLRDSNKAHSPPQFHLGPQNSRAIL